jgi:hypothetical protein
MSKDETLRVGFEEADKLWDLLKAYAKKPNKYKNLGKGDLFLSTDLTEATYNFLFEVMDENMNFLEEQFAEHPVMRVFSKLFRIHKREALMSDITDKYKVSCPETFITTRGCFMGDALSFIHLTLMLSACSYQASYCSMKGQKDISSIRYFEGQIVRPYSQTVGDDHIALNCDIIYCNSFRARVRIYGGSMSKIDSCGKYSGTFCEQGFCKPRDAILILNYDKGSIFGDIYFLDIIKGSIMTAKSKVKADGSSPFIGHVKMLQKQLGWHPVEAIKPIAN